MVMTIERSKPKTKNMSLPTDYAPAERTPPENLLHQHADWMAHEQTHLIGDAVPNVVLIINNTRQVVYANSRVTLFGNYATLDDYLGLRPGELINCTNANKNPGGCGTTGGCKTCGAVNTILNGLIGKKDEQECTIHRGEGEQPYHLRINTTPVQLNGEDYVIFSIQDIRVEKENLRLLEEVKKLAVLDPLTGVHNRRAFFEEAEREFARSLRYQRPLAVIMIDVDKFKSINDSYGHPEGDVVLKVIAETIRAQLRDLDLFGRYGGDEFIILLPESDLAGGRLIAERITTAISALEIDREGFFFHPSITAGVAGYTPSDRSLATLIARADRDLRVQKQGKL
jgi:diguanylate cyclase (GGDEF)-like protein